MKKGKKYRRQNKKVCLKSWNEYEKPIKDIFTHTGLFKYLIDMGLKPDNTVLDIGCGMGREGILLVNYLDKENYFGFDVNNGRLTTFFGGLIKYNLLTLKKPVVTLIEDFDISQFKKQFDFIISQSIFTHISTDNIEKCIKNTIPYLNDGGSFYASFWLSKDIVLNGEHGHGHTKQSYRFSKQPFEFYEGICEDICSVEYLGNRPWKVNQQLLRFYK